MDSYTKSLNCRALEATRIWLLVHKVVSENERVNELAAKAGAAKERQLANMNHQISDDLKSQTREYLLAGSYRKLTDKSDSKSHKQPGHS